MLAFLIFIGLLAHMMVAFFAHTLLEDTNISYMNKRVEWYKPKCKRYLLIPGVAEAALVLYFLTILVAIMFASITYFFKD
jgi:hypothetical protein